MINEFQVCRNHLVYGPVLWQTKFMCVTMLDILAALSALNGLFLLTTPLPLTPHLRLLCLVHASQLSVQVSRMNISFYFTLFLVT